MLDMTCPPFFQVISDKVALGEDVLPSLPFPATANNVSIRDSFSLPASAMGLRNFSVVPEVH